MPSQGSTHFPKIAKGVIFEDKFSKVQQLLTKIASFIYQQHK